MHICSTKLIHYGLVMPHKHGVDYEGLSLILVNIGSGNCLRTKSTKPLPNLMLIDKSSTHLYAFQHKCPCYWSPFHNRDHRLDHHWNMHTHFYFMKMHLIVCLKSAIMLRNLWVKHAWMCKFILKDSGPRLNIKTVLSTYGVFHVKDKTAVRTSYL